MINIIDYRHVGRNPGLVYLQVYPLNGDYRLVCVKKMSKVTMPSAVFVETSEPSRFIKGRVLPDEVLIAMTQGRPLFLVGGVETHSNEELHYTSRVGTYSRSHNDGFFKVQRVIEPFLDPIVIKDSNVGDFEIVTAFDIYKNPNFVYLRIFPEDGDYSNIQVDRAVEERDRAQTRFKGVFVRVRPEHGYLFHHGMALPMEVLKKLLRGENLLVLEGYQYKDQAYQTRVMRGSATENDGEEGSFEVTRIKEIYNGLVLIKESIL